VNFSNLASIAKESGFKVSGYTTQSMFLISLGINNYLKNEENEEKKVKIAQEIKQLVLPGTMGEVFKVMALSKKQSVKLEGFKELDLTKRL
jgi:SAM-dependent MidA family methyltransferase